MFPKWIHSISVSPAIPVSSHLSSVSLEHGRRPLYASLTSPGSDSLAISIVLHSRNSAPPRSPFPAIPLPQDPVNASQCGFHSPLFSASTWYFAFSHLIAHSPGRHWNNVRFLRSTPFSLPSGLHTCHALSPEQSCSPFALPTKLLWL